MTPAHFLHAGLSADYSAEILDFVRVFDSSDHDCSKLWMELQCFVKRMRKLFCEARILQRVPGALDQQTCTHVALANAKAAPPIHVGPLVFHLWHGGDVLQKEIAQRTMSSMKIVIELLSERLRADMPDDSIRMDFCIFDLSVYHNHRKSGSLDSFELWVKPRLKRLFRACSLDDTVGATQYFSCLPALYEHFEVDLSRDNASQTFDCRSAWSRIHTHTLQQVVGSVDILQQLVYIYVGIQDGTGQVERDLGLVRRVADAASSVGPAEVDLVSLYVEIANNGPQLEEQICGRLLINQQGQGLNGQELCQVVNSSPKQVLLNLNRWGTEFARRWVIKHGRRFHIYKKRKDAGGKKGARAGSEAAFVAASRRCSHIAAAVSLTHCLLIKSKPDLFFECNCMCCVCCLPAKITLLIAWSLKVCKQCSTFESRCERCSFHFFYLPLLLFIAAHKTWCYYTLV